MLPTPLLIIRALLRMQVSVLAAAAVVGAVVAATNVHTALTYDPHDERAFADLGPLFFEVGLDVAAVGGVAAVLLGVLARTVRDAGGRLTAVTVVVLAVVQGVAGLVAVAWATVTTGGDAAAVTTVLATPSLAVAALCVHPSSRRWLRQSWPARRSARSPGR